MQKRGGEKRGKRADRGKLFHEKPPGEKSNPQITKLSETLEEIGGKATKKQNQLLSPTHYKLPIQLTTTTIPVVVFFMSTLMIVSSFFFSFPFWFLISLFE